MKYRMYVGDVEWQKLKTALALKPSVQMLSLIHISEPTRH